MTIVKPKWLRKLHVAAHQGHQAIGCRLCETIRPARQWLNVSAESPLGRLLLALNSKSEDDNE